MVTHFYENIISSNFFNLIRAFNKKRFLLDVYNFCYFCVFRIINMYKRTNIEIDLDLVKEVMKKYRFKSMKDAINFSLENTVESIKRARLLKMKGKVSWEGNLDEMRNS